MTKETCLWLLLMFGVIAFVAYVLIMLGYLFPALLFGSRPAAKSESRHALVEEVEASGVSLAAISCSGRVGNVFIRGPLMSVDIRPSGLIVVSAMFGSSVVRVEQIKQLKYEQGFLRRGLWIIHTSPSVSSPIFLAGIGRDSTFAAALNSLIADKQPTSVEKFVT